MSQEEKPQEERPVVEPEITVTATEFKEVKSVQEPIKRISDISIDDSLIKKRGFLLTLSTDPLPEILLKEELNQVKEKYAEILTTLKSQRILREQHSQRELELLEQQDQALRDKRSEYAVYLDGLKDEQISLQQKLEELHIKVTEVLTQLGQGKEQVVSKSLADMKAELEQAMDINKVLQDEQNTELIDRYTRDKHTFEEKIVFWREILKKHQEHYHQVSERLKLLSRDGVNSQTAQFLIYLGGVSALVSGWWFSLWTGPQPTQNAAENVTGNTSVRFFFLDNIGKFLSGYSLGMMVLIIMAYVVGVGAFSWLCHRLLVKNGFILDVRELRKKKDKQNAEDQDNYDFDIEEQEKLLKAKIKSSAWWGLWLKVTPLILAFIPILGVISRQLSIDISNKNENGSFQGLFDSLVNEFIGTSIAIMFSVFMIIFLTRVSENKYHRKGDEEEMDDKPGFNIKYIGFIFFALMIVGMLLYHYPVLFFDDIRRVAIFGFTVSCLATGFGLGYGYIFNGLKSNSEMLLFYIDTITSIVHYLSKPYQVNYTTNWSLKLRIYALQQKMFDLIEGRALLATDISSGKQVSNVKRPTLVVQTTPQSESKPEDDRKNSEQGPKEAQSKPEVSKTQKNPSPVMKRIYSWFSRKKYDHSASSDEYLDEMTVSQTDMAYFPEIATCLKELHHRMQELRDRIGQIRSEEEYRWRNLGVWHSIHDQINYNRQKIEKVEQDLADHVQQCLVEEVLISHMEKKESTLLTEGYYTGLWFREIDPARQFNVDTLPQQAPILNV